MTIDETMDELKRIKAAHGGNVVVSLEIDVKRTSRGYDYEADEPYEETVTEKGFHDVASISCEMHPPSRGDCKRKVIFR